MLILLSQIEIRRIILFLHIKGLKLILYNINEYISISIYISAIKNDITIFYRITREIYLIDNLKVYILINNDIIKFEKIVLNID